METRSTSQQQFQKLKMEVRQNTPAAPAELAGSFSAFCQWLEASDDTSMKQAIEIAIDTRLWRDSQDVLRHLWEQIYRH